MDAHRALLEVDPVRDAPITRNGNYVVQRFTDWFKPRYFPGASA